MEQKLMRYIYSLAVECKNFRDNNSLNIAKGVKKMFLMETKLDYLDILILASLVRNGSRKVVANDVGISERTLRRHIKKLYTLLNVQNDIKLALAAINAGIVDSYGNILK